MSFGTMPDDRRLTAGLRLPVGTRAVANFREGVKRMAEETRGVTWAVVGWIAFGLGQVVHDPFAKLLLLATARVLP